MQQESKLKYGPLVFWSAVAGYLLFAIYVFISFNNLAGKNKYANRRFITSVYVPRWNVYTRLPSEPVYQLYRVDGNLITFCDLRPFSPQYLFGLKRNYKIIAEELKMLMCDSAVIRSAGRHVVNLAHDTELGALLSADTLRFTNVAGPNYIYLQGQYIVTMSKPVTREQAMAGRQHPRSVTIIPLNISNSQ